MIPDGDHLPLYDGGVQLLHAADVPRPLELLWVDEEDGLFDPRKDLVIQRGHPGVQRDATPDWKGEVIAKYRNDSTQYLHRRLGIGWNRGGWSGPQVRATTSNLYNQHSHLVGYITLLVTWHGSARQWGDVKFVSRSKRTLNTAISAIRLKSN